MSLLFFVKPSTTEQPTDPYAANVSLLLRGDGTNGSTAFVDSSPSAKTLTVTGSAQISTTQKKWGTGSIYIPTGNSYVSAPSSADFALGTGDFTTESWVYTTDTTFNLQTLFSIGSYTGGLLFRLYNPSAGILDAYCNGQQYSFNKSAISVNTWHHVALVRSSGTVTAYVDGEQFGTSQSMPQNIAQNSIMVGMSSHNSNEYIHGYLDDFRITKGVARYTGTFTPPSAM